MNDSKTLEVVVASTNPVKVGAVRAAFEACLPGRRVEVDGVEARSGVAEQPRGDDETLTGARNRLRDARQQRPDADYWVGLEGGITENGDTLLAFAWMVVGRRDGRTGEARSATLPLPPGVRDLLRQGLELGEANDRVFTTENSKQAGGAFGLLTDGRHTRESVYAQAVELALIPLLHPLFRSGRSRD